MKKFTTLFVALTLLVGAGFATMADGNGLVVGTSVSLEANAEFDIYVGWAAISNPFSLTLAKTNLTSWTGKYTFGAWYDFYFGPHTDFRLGAKTTVKVFDNAPAKFKSLAIAGGVMLRPLPFLAIGAIMEYDGGLMLKVNLEFTPQELPKANTGE